jgi:hypothetical protein
LGLGQGAIVAAARKKVIVLIYRTALRTGR